MKQIFRSLEKSCNLRNKLLQQRVSDKLYQYFHGKNIFLYTEVSLIRDSLILSQCSISMCLETSQNLLFPSVFKEYRNGVELK